jgi:glycosyltransferase involved in cell wall biosynthesis
VQVVYNGIELARFAGRVGEREEVRRELGLAPGTFVILQVARLDYLKDHLTAVRTLGRVARQVPDVRLVLVGEGPEGLAIEAQVEQLGLTGQVLFLGLRKDVGRLLQAADLFLLTSVSEGIPLTVIEAMAAGLPVVVTQVGGLPEVVQEGVTGLLAPPGDDAALADRILSLAGRPERRAELGRLGRERSRELFSEDSMHAAYLKLYEEMLRD